MDIPHIEDVIDMSSPYATQYLDLINTPSTDGITDTHHIVPVAFYRDVLGMGRVRMASTPDMDSRNLVKLTPGRHLLAHYYLCKCARKCIKVQMENAFSLMYSTFNLSSVTDSDVLLKANELDAEYAKIKHRKKTHKDGAEAIFRSTCTLLRHWHDGKQSGVFGKWDNDGNIIEFGDIEQDVIVIVRPENAAFMILSNYLNFTIDWSGRFFLTEWNERLVPYESRHVEAYLHSSDSVLIGRNLMPSSVDSQEVRDYMAKFSCRARRIIDTAPAFITIYAPKSVKNHILPVLYRFSELYGAGLPLNPITVPEMPVKRRKNLKCAA